MNSTYETLVEAMPVYQEQLREWLAGNARLKHGLCWLMGEAFDYSEERSLAYTINAAMEARNG